MKFLVVEDHALTREGVRLALGTLGDEVTVLDAASVDAAFAAIKGNPEIDLVLLDLGLPGGGGFSLLQDLRRDRSTVPLVVISGAEDRSTVLKAFDLGVLGFIPKSCSIDVMLQAVRLVMAGGMYIPQQAMVAMRDAPEKTAGGRQRIRDLTDRQREILALMARGKPNKVIAVELHISEATVKSHVTEILRVLKVTNRTQAVIVAGDLGVR